MKINPLNEAALNYWCRTKYTEEDILKFCYEFDDKYLFAKLEFKEDGGLAVNVSSTVGRTRQGHFPSYLKFFNAVQSYNAEQPLKGTIIAFFEDGFWSWITHLAQSVPIFHCGQFIHDYYSFLIPDGAFLNLDGQVKDRQEIDQYERRLSWNQKYEKLIWRGAGSGIGIGTADWREAPRIKLCLRAKEFQNKDLIDAGITKILDVGNPEYEQGIITLGLQGDEIPFLEFLDYKYQLDVDGMCCAWLSYFRKLCSNTVTFKVESEYRQWYYHGLKPWKHFIPVTKDMAELENLLLWAMNHDTACEEMAKLSTEYMKTVSVESAVSEAYHALHTLFTAQQQLG